MVVTASRVQLLLTPAWPQLTLEASTAAAAHLHGAQASEGTLMTCTWLLLTQQQCTPVSQVPQGLQQ